MLDLAFLPFWAFFAGLFAPRHNARIQFLVAQVGILRARIAADRIVPTPQEKAELLRWGAGFGHSIDGVIWVVTPATYRRWLRMEKRKIPFRKSGRPRIAECIRRLARTMAVENVLWGYQRIVGELKKLGCRVGKTTVKRILEEEGIHPLPTKAGKKPPVEWATFVRAHMETLIACDFFTKPVYTLRGKFHACVLVFIHLASRKAFCSPPTYTPDGDWVMQQAPWLDEIGVAPRHLIHDRDGRYPGRFGAFWKTEGVRCIRIPPRAPTANAFCECFIGKIKRECLDHFLCFSRGQLHHILTTWLRHYNTRRPHQGSACGTRSSTRPSSRKRPGRFGAGKSSAGSSSRTTERPRERQTLRERRAVRSSVSSSGPHDLLQSARPGSHDFRRLLGLATFLVLGDHPGLCSKKLSR